MKHCKRFASKILGVIISFFVTSAFSSAFTATINDEFASLKEHPGRNFSMSPEVASEGVYVDDLHSPMPTANYDALHSLQSGIRTSEEIQKDFAKIVGPGSLIQWNSDFWQKNKIKSPLKLVSILSQEQNLETRFEILHLLTLPSEKRRETSITLFTDKVNSAEEQTLRSSILIAKEINIDHGRPLYDFSKMSRYDFHLRSGDTQDPFDRREPDGMYELAGAIQGDQIVDPFAQLSQVNGSFNEIGNYEYDQSINGQHCTVSIVPRFLLGAQPQLTIEIQIHEAESLTIKSFVLVYE